MKIHPIQILDTAVVLLLVVIAVNFVFPFRPMDAAHAEAAVLSIFVYGMFRMFFIN